jgi:hypothetical protein
VEHADDLGLEIGPPAVRVEDPKSSPSDAAIALIVKSRRARSSAIVPVSTSGSAAGAR